MAEAPPTVDDAVVPLGGTLRQALLSLERTGFEIVLFSDAAGALAAIATDGDLRRAMLHGAALDSPIEPFANKQFVKVRREETRANVLDMMRALRMSEIPIVDAAGKPVGLHLLHDMVVSEKLPSWAVVMAGGRGTRLAPITQHLPKPMIHVAGRPILERIVLHLAGSGIGRVFLSINYLGHMVEEHFGDGRRVGCRVDYLREEKALGTGGALSLLPEVPRDPVLVMNGDLVTQFDVKGLLASHRASGAKATIAARRYFHSVPFGCLTLDGTRLVRMVEKPTLTQMVNAGIYVLDPDLPARIPKDTEYTLPQLLEDCLARGEHVNVWELEDDWIDVGQREQLKEARGEAT